jgi:hypothetical protein
MPKSSHCRLFEAILPALNVVRGGGNRVQKGKKWEKVVEKGVKWSKVVD